MDEIISKEKHNYLSAARRHDGKYSLIYGIQFFFLNAGSFRSHFVFEHTVLKLQL